MAKRVYLFNEGNKDDRELLGGKGANLCEMTAMGLPVPFGFVITTATCREYFQTGNKMPSLLEQEYRVALDMVEKKMGARFGDPENPLLFSVRSGAPVSMPGMMNTILNLGLNDDIAAGLAAKTNNPRFAYDCYRRFISMFADVVMGVPGEKFESEIEKYKAEQGKTLDVEMTAADWQAIIAVYKTIVDFPEDPFEQLKMAVEAVFQSWHTPRALIYREMNNISDTLGTAVSVQAMVFGNFGDDSGSGVAFTRNPSTGEKMFFGEFLFNAAGEDVVAGTRTPLSVEALQEQQPEVYDELYKTQALLESHYRDMQDLEFTVQEGRFYMLQTRSGKRTGRAAVKIAVNMVDEGLIEEAEALMRVSPEHVEAFLHPTVDPKAKRDIVAIGLPASPGGATGEIVFSAEEAEEVSAKGRSVILVRRETTPEDIHGMKVAAGILTELGGMTSHAAVVARGMGVCAITGCGTLSINHAEGTVQTKEGVQLKRGDIITLDGTSGEVMLGDIPKTEASSSDDFQTLLGWADEHRRLKIRANAETPEDAAKARELGAEGIGLCRTEHMFFEAKRIEKMRAMILSESVEERQQYLDELLEFQRADMLELFRAMDGLPVTIRLLDPPLHEFLPHNDGDMEALAKVVNKPVEKIREITEGLSEVNPMLGFRGCRLSIVYPEITEMQVKAIMSAAADAVEQGIKALPEIMIPLVVNVREIRMINEIVDRGVQQVLRERLVSVPYKVGTMMETPRAALGADRLAPEVEFMSFGTNDLTQMTYGFSRDDVGKFIPRYIEKKLVDADPFVTLDQRAVGRLMEIAVKESRRAKKGIKYGICGEHGGDPRSIRFCHNLGLDYVSCSPFRVPIARIAAAQANVESTLED
ncbi:MAG: pyruvate, phosphate dikinase [Halioglobus sp.]|jgi:pyruvate,orthophosphate dikinase|nr:pyruvate, phosphate dikinase [marine gamma proteobacterium HTCC2148]MBT5006259.1 pyruvate, phosphate dikinase [Halieaceae bacterium]MBT6124510.1 pyruvate, phosphate dikinase [Halieaceae bacterium]MDG1387071.1 pyruvate, phosphate dikinase [Halioglobus sp.]MDG2325336.1 pyruvate, phosphate dikinase [Halioglobus sp.]